MLQSSWSIVLLAKLAFAACQDPSPLSLPIADIRLSNGYTKRGIPGAIGSPPQNFSFMPQNFLNDTWVFNTSAPFCLNGTTNSQCLTQRGGEYDPGSSSTAHAGLNVYAAGGDSSDTDREQATHIWYNSWATDSLVLDNTTMPDFPIGMAGFDFGGRFDTQANIGLGTNSTILTALKDAAHISSRTYSYWWGIESTSSAVAMDGQIVFGGYDAAKTTGPNVTQTILPWTLACPSGMYVTVTSLLLDFPNGTTADILSPSTLSACLQPDFPVVMSLRNEPFYERFETLTDTYYVNRTLGTYWYAPVYEPSSVFSGDLTIGLADGLSIKVPNDVLVVSEQYVGPSGAVETNASASVVLIAPDMNDNTNDTPIIGMQFFSAAYLMVDLDAGTFTIWQANATSDSRLVTVGGTCSETPVTNASDSSTTSSSSSTPTDSGNSSVASPTTSSSAANGSRRHSISTGVIVGAAIGGAFVLAACAVATLLVCMKRRRSAKSAAGSNAALTVTNKPTVSHGSSVDASPDGWFYAHSPGTFEPMSEQINEMSASQAHPHELSSMQRPIEMPGETAMGPVEMASVQTPTHARQGWNR
ncbi:hypothetical protein LTR85_007485 [Meristemomyces frigidus]|nr:hypothetical protein LTR85_007485 [Meristemomyces frigidus]